MKYGIISDIHSNHEALVNVIEELKSEKVDKIICCGDITGYGPDPNECIELIKKYNILSLKGNHDAAVLNEANLEWFNKDAKDAIVLNQKILNKENLLFLSLLQEQYIESIILFVHGSPRDCLYEYLITTSSLRINAKYMKQQITFCGHTHIPLVYQFDSKLSKENIIIPHSNTVIRLDYEKKYIINVGSVGQPRDRDNRGCCVIFDTENSIIEYRRVEYNFILTQEKMKKLNFPDFLITRLEFGE
ncbi:MAG: metallophosphatase family protein [Endomicrobia bacterium]|nr:metallophosphatase family protein [Endomicrobiia bacterium]